VPVNTQPRSAPLRLFFFCWVCYSFAISTVFQAYFTTFLIETGYEEPIKTVEQMLASDMKFGFFSITRLSLQILPNPLTPPFSKTRFVALMLSPVSIGQFITTTFQQFSMISLKSLGKLQELGLMKTTDK
jgi:hypothetical protein